MCGFVETANTSFTTDYDEQTILLETLAETLKERKTEADSEKKWRKKDRRSLYLDIAVPVMGAATFFAACAAVVGGSIYGYREMSDNTAEFDANGIEFPSTANAASLDDDEWSTVTPLSDTGLSKDEQRTVEEDAPLVSEKDTRYSTERVVHAVESQGKQQALDALREPANSTLFSNDERLLRDDRVSRYLLQPESGSCATFITPIPDKDSDDSARMKVLSSNQSPDGFIVSEIELVNYSQVDPNGLSILYNEAVGYPDQLFNQTLDTKEIVETPAVATTVCRTKFSEAAFFISRG